MFRRKEGRTEDLHPYGTKFTPGDNFIPYGTKFSLGTTSTLGVKVRSKGRD
jgi:hypothetical protein